MFLKHTKFKLTLKPSTTPKFYLGIQIFRSNVCHIYSLLHKDLFVNYCVQSAENTVTYQKGWPGPTWLTCQPGVTNLLFTLVGLLPSIGPL